MKKKEDILSAHHRQTEGDVATWEGRGGEI